MNSERKLTTIMAMDAVNFSKMMSEKEEITLRNLNQCREIIDEIITQNNGVIFNTGGDSVMSSFQSVIECIKAAHKIQQELYKRNELSTTELPIEFRIGITTDDVIIEGNNLFGQGVNISSRIESECPPGKILISRVVKDQIENKIEYPITSIGKKSLKNIGEMELFLIGGLSKDEDDFFNEEETQIDQKDNLKDENIEVKRTSTKPKIAILTFKNVTKNDDSVFLSESITGDLIIEFSRSKEMDVVSKKTCDDHEKSGEDALTFAKKNKIDFLVGGNIRSSGNRLRVTVDLTNAKDGSIIWAEKFDRIFEEIFDIEDEILEKISTQLLGNIENTNVENIKRKPTENLDSYENLVIGRYHWLRQSLSKEHNTLALEHFDKSIKLDEKNARSHSLKACTIGGGLGKQYYEDNDKMMKMLFYHVEKGLEYDDKDYEVRRISCAISLMQKKYDEAEEHGRIAYSMNPNDPRVLAVYGEILVRNNKTKLGIELLKKTLELDAIPAGQKNSDNRYRDLVLGYFCAEDYENCLNHAKKIKDLEPRSWLFMIYSINNLEENINLKENEFYKSKSDEFSKLDWTKTIDGFHLPNPEMNKTLENFSKEIIN